MNSKQDAAERANPKHGMAHVERGARVDAQVQKAQATRRTQLANVKPVQPSTNPIPALTNAPKVAIAPFLKKQG
jgi:hypothetical protein